MKRPKISEAISPLTKSRHSAKTPAAALLDSRAAATKHDLYIALVLRVRDRLSANRREHPELRRFECARVTYFVGGVFARSASGE
jgi:hypothetical protein